MHLYPVYFRASGPVIAGGFVAHSCISGRMLIQIGENDQTEIWTASPSGVYVNRGSLDDAVTAAVEELGRGLSVLAQDSGDYAEFDMRAQRLLEHPLDSLEERWTAACSGAANLPNRAEFERLIEAPALEIASTFICERPLHRPEMPQMIFGDLLVEQRAA